MQVSGQSRMLHSEDTNGPRLNDLRVLEELFQNAGFV